MMFAIDGQSKITFLFILSLTRVKLHTSDFPQNKLFRHSIKTRLHCIALNRIGHVVKVSKINEHIFPALQRCIMVSTDI